MRDRITDLIVRATTAAALTVAVAYVALAQGAGDSGVKPQAVNAMNQVFRSLIATNNIVQASMWVELNGSGLIDSGNFGRQAGTVAPMATGSMSITALCTLQLIDSRRLDSGATVQVLLPEFTATLDEPFRSVNAASIRVGHLIQHASGLDFDSTKDATSFATAAASPKPDEAFARLSINRALAASPGTSYIPNNVNYALLGMIIKKVTGESYESFCMRTVLTPRGITNARIAAGLTALEAFGGWEMSARDYVKFFVGAFSPTALASAAALSFMNSLPVPPFSVPNCPMCNYGLGVIVMPVGESRSGPASRHDVFHHGDWFSAATTPSEAGFFAASYTNGMTVALNYDRHVLTEAGRQALDINMRIAAYAADPPTVIPNPPATIEDQFKSIFRN